MFRRKLVQSVILVLSSLILPTVGTGQTVCTGGLSATYPCNNVDFYSRITLGTFSALRGNDCWAWISKNTGKPYVLMGLNNGMAVVEVSDPVNPKYIGKLPKHSSNSTWRDIKVYKDRAYVVSEASGHGMQVFDLRQLDTITEVNLPRTFSATARHGGFGSAHNMVINEASGFGCAVGTNGNNKGLYIMDLRSPDTPRFVKRFNGSSNRGYTHDAQMVYYHGPDPAYQGMELAFMSDENKFIIANLDDKNNITEIANTSYPRRGYTHQGWLSPDHKYWYMNDELDELNVSAITNTRTLVWDVTDLDNPLLMMEYFGPNGSIDHNLYTKGNYVYQANYTSGLRILDASLIMCDSLRELAFFDSYKNNNSTSFNGSWSVYPYLDSVVALSNISEGLFLLKPNLPPNDSELEITANPAAVEAGNQFLVNVTFSNPKSLSNLTIKSKLPQGCTYVPNSATNGGTFSNGEVSFPIGNYVAGQSISRTYACLAALSPYSQGEVPAMLLTDDAESSSSPLMPLNEAGQASFSRSSQGVYSGTYSWCAAPASSAERTILQTSSPVILKGYAQSLSFQHSYDFRNAGQSGRDGGVVEISLDGVDWEDLGSKITSNPYDGTISSSSSALDGHAAFTGNSGGYIETKIDLSEYSGYPVHLRFRAETDSVLPALPWCIDDVEISASSLGSPVYLEMTCCAINSEGENASARRAVQVIPPSTPLPLESLEIVGAKHEVSNEVRVLRWPQGDILHSELLVIRPGREEFSVLPWSFLPGTSFFDTEVDWSGEYIYMLRIQLSDGNWLSSNAVSIVRESGKGFLNISPNPAVSEVRMKVFWPEQKAVGLSIRDAQGRLIEAFQHGEMSGEWNVSLDISKYAKGIYFIELLSGTQRIHKRLVKY